MNQPLQTIEEFARPMYMDKDIMHDWSHLDRVRYVLNDLLETTSLDVDPFIAKAGLYFHGIIYSHEKQITEFLDQILRAQATLIVQVAWESQKEGTPTTNEGLIVHDAHMLEGGANFEIIKSLITGSIRGQTLLETMHYIKGNVLNKGQCYTPEGKKRYAVMKERTLAIYSELVRDLGIDSDD